MGVKHAMVQVRDKDGCVTGWAVRIVSVAADTTNEGAGVVPIRDEDGCVTGWAVRVQVVSTTPAP